MFEFSSTARLIGWWVLLFFVSFLLSSLTKGGMSQWYQGIIRPTFTPPSYIIGPVWAVLYLMMGTSAWLLWESPEFAAQPLAKKLFLGQLAFNWLWTPVFFGAHLVGLALLCTLFMQGLSVAYFFVLKDHLSLAAYLFIPYILWLGLVICINTFIWLYN